MNIQSLLIANRGEIALRILRACRKMGLRAVAVYSDADRHAPHVTLADTAIHIGPSPARDSYLDLESIMEAVKRSGVDAVHPGYGFLSENPAFARACEDFGCLFIGPPSHVIERMGSKQRARAAAAAVGVPIVAGYHGNAQDDDSFLAAAHEIGYPVMIKASAGGGGRGMRRVHHAADLVAALRLARGEAEAAFGDATLLLERLIEQARHVEVQILADRHGHVVHLLDRDCTVQRSHQKLVEEAPATVLSAKVRENMLRQSVSLAREIGYTNAGTVEFIHDVQRGDCLFLEMNTRLQVEHPVTEAITGVDIVEWQIRIADGESLTLDQAAVGCRGHAIEARITTEDVSAGFMPRTGTVIKYREPKDAGLRIDSGIRAGSVIGHYYDSMIAKVIVHDIDRDRARRRLIHALRAYTIHGVETNMEFLQDVLATASFAGGTHTTDLIDEAFGDGWHGVQPAPHHLGELALGWLLTQRQARGAVDPWSALGGWRVGSGRQGTSVCYGKFESGEPVEILITGSAGGFSVQVDSLRIHDKVYAVWEGNCLMLEIDGEHRRVPMSFRGSSAWHGECPGVCVELLAPEQVLLGRAGQFTRQDNQLCAPMPGRLMEVRVNAGDRVCAGQVLAVLEAMKLYQELVAWADGTVMSVHRKAGDVLESGALILEIGS
jgi:acetyl/propionyl-CoA carboxylase alpha subunit